MNKFLIIEFTFLSAANITIWEQIFTIDLAKSVLIISTQLIITLCYKSLTSYLTRKKEQKMRLLSISLQKLFELVKLIISIIGDLKKKKPSDSQINDTTNV